MAVVKITRTNADPFIPVQQADEIIQEAIHGSVALNLFPHTRVTSGSKEYKTLTGKPVAGWVTQDGGIKPKTNMTWGTRTMAMEELAAIVIIAEDTLEDADRDIVGEVIPAVGESFSLLIDDNVLNGVGPMGTGILPDAITQGNTSAKSTLSFIDYTSVAMGQVESDGFVPNFALTHPGNYQTLRDESAVAGSPIYLANARSDSDYSSVWNVRLEVVSNGSWDAATYELLVGDTEGCLIGIRNDIQLKVLTEANLYSGTVDSLNLAETDQIALRFRMRIGYMTKEHETAVGGASAYPFAAVTVA